MPNDASGKGSADAASKSRLTKTQLDAILSLAAAGDVEPKAEAAQPDARGAAGAAHVAIWDTVNEVKLSGANAPTTETLAAFLRAHPHCVVFNGQKPSRRAATGAATERSGLDRLVVASGAPPSLGERPPTPREHASHGGEEPAKRSMYTPEQLQRLQAEFEACELPSKERREALAAELDIPTRSVQIWFQNRRQRVKSASHGAKRSGGSGAEPASGNEEEEAAEARPAAERSKEKKPRRGKAEKNSATSAIDSLAMISSMAAGHSSLSSEAEAR